MFDDDEMRNAFKVLVATRWNSPGADMFFTGGDFLGRSYNATPAMCGDDRDNTFLFQYISDLIQWHNSIPLRQRFCDETWTDDDDL